MDGRTDGRMGERASIYHVTSCHVMSHHITALERADAIARQADIVAALTLEVLKGTTKAFQSGKC